MGVEVGEGVGLGVGVFTGVALGVGVFAGVGLGVGVVPIGVEVGGSGVKNVLSWAVKGGNHLAAIF